MGILKITNGTVYGSQHESLTLELESGDFVKIKYLNLTDDEKNIYDDFFNLSGDNLFFEIINFNMSNNIDRDTNKEFSNVSDYIDYSTATTSVKSKVDKFYALIENHIQ